MPRNYQKEYAKESERLSHLGVRIDKDLKDLFFNRCKNDGVIPSQWIIEQIKKYLDS